MPPPPAHRLPARPAAARTRLLGGAVGAGLLAAGVLSGCAADELRCPGRAEGTFRLHADRTDVSCAAGAPAAGFDALYPVALDFDATISFAGEGTAAALCTLRRGSEPLTGSHQGDQLSVALETPGAVLAACSGACAVAVRQEVSGALVRDPVSGRATGFAGTLVERATAAAGADCAPCTPPCQATYDLTVVP